MVEKNRIFLVVGDGFLGRQSAIASIKNKISRPGSPLLSTVIIYGGQVEAVAFEEKVLTFSFDGDKIIIIKDAQELPAAAKDFFLNNFKKLTGINYFIFEIDKDPSFFYGKKNCADKFLSFILKNALIFKTPPASRDATIDDFRLSARRRDLAASLYIAEKLFAKGNSRELAPLMLGILLGVFGYTNDYSRKEKYLGLFLEADRNIKEKNLDPRLTIDLLLTKLMAGDKPGKN